MRGTELTEAQLQHAREFIAGRRAGADRDEMPGDAQMVTQGFGDLVRLLAWYGALRYESGARGEGSTLERPGRMIVKK